MLTTIEKDIVKFELAGLGVLLEILRNSNTPAPMTRKRTLNVVHDLYGVPIIDHTVRNLKRNACLNLLFFL